MKVRPTSAQSPTKRAFLAVALWALLLVQALIAPLGNFAVRADAPAIPDPQAGPAPAGVPVADSPPAPESAAAVDSTPTPANVPPTEPTAAVEPTVIDRAPTTAPAPATGTTPAAPRESPPASEHPLTSLPLASERDFIPPAPALGGTSGLLVGLGLGPSHGGTGLQAGYLWAFSEPFHLQAGLASALGYVWGQDEADGSPTAAVSLLGYWGRVHRPFVELSYGPTAYHYIERGGLRIAQEILYGPSAVLGYEYMAQRGFYVRIGLGRAWETEDWTQSTGVTLALGQKLW